MFSPCGLKPVKLLLILFVTLCASKIYAQTDVTEIQTFIDSTIYRNFIDTYLDNGIQSANFSSRINYNNTSGKINYYLKNYYSSAVTKLNTNFYRDFENIKTGAGYKFNNDFNAYVNYTGMLFSDDKNIQLKGSSSSLFNLSGFYEKNFTNYTINSNVNAGYKLEKQIGELNRGISLAGEFNVDNLFVSDFFIDGQLKLGYEDLDPRKKNLVVSRLYFDKSFNDNLARNEFEGFYSRIRKDFYFPADAYTKAQFDAENNIEKRTESIIKAYDRFDYTISDNTQFYINVNPYYRDIIKENFYIPKITTASPSIYDTRIQELSLGGEAAILFDYDKINFQVKASYKERDEKHFLINADRIASNFVKEKELLESSKNNHSSRFKFDGNIYYSPTYSNRFELSTSSSILKYDTPSESNSDDRDELNVILYLGHRYNNLNNFILTTSIDLNLYHTVYIFSEKSANNNWNRVLRFTANNIFTPAKGLRTVNTFSVLANYTVYDFEDIISTVRSYSFRQMNFKDSTILRFTEELGLDIYGEIKLYERGELNWNAFSERPLNYFEDKIINSQLNYFFNKFIIISGGFRFFEQRRFKYTEGNKIFDTYIRTYGPMAKLRVDWKGNSRVEIIASYDYYDYNNKQPSASNGNLYINVFWNF
jgi:hypothetical protein